MTPNYIKEKEKCPRHKIFLKKSKFKGPYCPKCAAGETGQARASGKRFK